MAITVKHNKVSTIPDTDDTSLVRPSDWNADHTLVGTIDVANGGTGASTLTGYVKGNGTSAMTAVATVPSTDITGLGTMSTQNANAVAITGGTINGTTIGATTPSSIVGTTITGQTGVLRGTGSNLILNSQGIGGTSWVNSGTATSTQNSAVAPDLTTTASTITSASNLTFGGNNTRSASTNIVSGTTYTASCYVKLGTATTCSIGLRDNSTGTVVSSTTTTAGSWVRLTATITYGSSTTSTVLILGNANGTFFAWGAQLELGSTANTYIPTTTTAVYGTPTLSFSGVSTLGLESNGALFLQPAGTGAIQAQATTSTTAGGNARGANAVDWQTIRGSANQVASGQYSVVGGGTSNRNSSFGASVVGGGSNTITTGSYQSVVGGTSNSATGDWSVLVGGQSNTTAGVYNFIGGGFTNSGTSGSTVTTQSGTMNGTTAVTLSGSNANIKVGQAITGTSIAVYTYVAAISGTSLTLSQNASGSSTSTLSFFTPHGVVVGGGNNQATGSYSFIGGGGDAGTAANRNVASGDWSFVGGGINSKATGLGAVVCGGGTASNANTASGQHSFIGSGGAFGANTASGIGSFIGSGWSNGATGAGSSVLGIGGQANADYSSVLGGSYGNARSIQGNSVFSASNAPMGTIYTNQAALLILARQTTDATATALTSNTSAAGTTNQVILPNNSAYLFKATVISNVTGGGNTSGWKLEGVIKRGANAASTAIVGSVTTTLLAQDAGASGWVIAATADTTNGGLRITFTGQASTTIRTVCKVETTEVTF